MYYRDEETDGIVAVLMVFIMFLFIGGLRFIAQSIKRADCIADAKALKLQYEYHGHWLASDKCVYILPNGKRILSTQYRDIGD